MVWLPTIGMIMTIPLSRIPVDVDRVSRAGGRAVRDPQFGEVEDKSQIGVGHPTTLFRWQIFLDHLPQSRPEGLEFEEAVLADHTS